MKRIALGFVCYVCFFNNNCFAGEAELNAKILELEAKVARLERLVEQTVTENVQGSVPQNKPLVVRLPSSVKQDDSKIKEVKIFMKPDPVIESENGDFTFSPNGRLQTDAAFFKDDNIDNPDGANIRRLYLGFDGKMYNDWVYRLQGNFANNESKIVDAYISYTAIPNTTITLGQFLEPFSLEELTNDLHTTFIERASLNTLSFARNIGGSVSRYNNNWSITAGVFGDDSGVSSADDEAYSVTARATYAPIKEADQLLHMGTAASYRSPDRSTDSVRYRSKAENVNTSYYSVDTGLITEVENLQHYGAEIAAVWRNFSVQGEYAIADIHQKSAGKNMVSAWYTYASWFLTGESRNYLGNKGIFDRLVPKRDFNFRNGGTGAWEIAARFSNLDLNDNVITGGKMDNYTAALNWYPTSYTRLSGNYTIVDTDEESTTANDNPQILLLRAQVDF